MKVLSWNCNCKFRDKYQLLKKYNADILIIQECEDPQQSSDSEYKQWAKNYLWVGDKKHQYYIKSIATALKRLQTFLTCIN